MTFTPSEIKNIQRLARSEDLENGLLAFELIRGRGLVPKLVTDLYCLYNKQLWAGKEAQATIIYDFFRSYWSVQLDFEHLAPILAPPYTIQKLHPDFEFHAMMLKLDLHLIAQQIAQRFPIKANPVNRFLFKYGTTAMQEAILPFLKIREHTGRYILDLGGFKLKTLPNIILKEKNVQILKIWGNELEELPDFWEQFKLLEIINLAENKLKTLPPSFNQLRKLQKIYAQNNLFNIETILDTVRQLPNIKYLSVASPINDYNHYNKSENTVLRQCEELVNHGKIHASQKEQALILALYLEQDTALEKLKLSDLFEALSDNNLETRKRAKKKLLHWENAMFKTPLQVGDSVATLGIVSFATRNKIQQLASTGIHFSTEIEEQTSHILIGDYPENYTAVNERAFIFMCEEDLAS